MARIPDKFQPGPLWVLTDCYCYNCGKRGKGYANLNWSKRIQDGRYPAICSRCAEADIAFFNRTKQNKLFEDWDEPEANTDGSKR